MVSIIQSCDIYVELFIAFPVFGALAALVFSGTTTGAHCGSLTNCVVNHNFHAAKTARQTQKTR